MTDRIDTVGGSTGQLDLYRRWLNESAIQGRGMAASGYVSAAAYQSWQTKARELVEKTAGSRWVSTFEAAGDTLDPVTEYEYRENPTEAAGGRLRAMRIGQQAEVLPDVVQAIDRNIALIQEARVPAPPPGEALPAQDFAFMRNARLRTIAARDYNELSAQITNPATLKSRTVLAGAVTEALLLDLMADPTGAIPAPCSTSLSADLSRARRRRACSSRQASTGCSASSAHSRISGTWVILEPSCETVSSARPMRR